MLSWKRSTVADSDIEKEIVTGLITDSQYLKEIQSIYSPELFQIPFSKTIARWCFEYYNKYKKAPEADIQELFEAWSNGKNIDESQVELIEKFLSNLSDEYEKKSNIKYHIDKAEKYFRKRNIEIHREKLSLLLIEDRVDEAEKQIGTFKRIARPETVGIDIIYDKIEKYFTEEEDVILQFPGALGELFGPFCRQDFVGIAAPMKRGKTFICQEIGIRGLMRDLSIAYFDIESGANKILKRIYQGFLGESKTEKVISIPYFDKEGYIEYNVVQKKGITVSAVRKKRKQLQRMLRPNKFRLLSYPTYSINVDDIKLTLDNLDHYEKFIPDIIIVDYADILGVERYSSKEERHKLNATWGALRGLAQERNCLVVTGTQLNKATFNRDANEEDIAEDIRKLAHVTHMIALNQNKEDKKKGIMRISTLVARDTDYYVDSQVIALECKAIGKPILDARWAKNVKDFQKN